MDRPAFQAESVLEKRDFLSYSRRNGLVGDTDKKRSVFQFQNMAVREPYRKNAIAVILDFHKLFCRMHESCHFFMGIEIFKSSRESFLGIHGDGKYGCFLNGILHCFRQYN